MKKRKTIKQRLQKFMVSVDRASGAVSVTELTPSWAERLVTAARVILRPGTVPDWFGPGQPLPPQAPDEIKGRQFDFPITFNTVSQPKAGELLPSVPYAVLRRLADTCDFLRLVIETRKDQICKAAWDIGPRDPNVKADQRCKDLIDFFQFPDKEHTWDDWLRLILEDKIVCDAATLYPQLARDGSLYALYPIDGTTIKRVIDDFGRTPQPPYPAYQQYLKGMAADDYTTDELIYRPQNVRTNRVYGFGIVEQIIITITLALNRQAYQLQYYTEGSTPDLIMSCPPEWTPQQVAEFSEYWDSRLKGTESGGKHSTMFVFNGMDAMNTKETILSDKFDEWLARIICFAFSMSPAPFTAQVNRATAQSAAEQAKEEGLAPQMRWVKNLMDYIISKYFNAPDLCFTWKEEDDVDQETAATIEDLQIRNGSLLINEAREGRGQDPVEGGDIPYVFTAGGATPLSSIKEQADAAIDTAKAGAEAVRAGGAALGAQGAKGNGAQDQNKDDPKSNLKKSASLRGRIALKFKTVANDVARQVHARLTKAKAKDVNQIIESLDLGALGDLSVDVVDTLGPAYTTSFTSGVSTVGGDASDFTLAPIRGKAYAMERAAELISKDASGGELGDSTRLLIRGTIEQALDEGWNQDKLSEELADSYGFSDARADVIASNEMHMAIQQGQYEGWKQTGVVTGKRWLMADDEGACDDCEENANAGVIGIDDTFPSGDDAPPAHPNCRCDLEPVLDDTDEE